VTTAPAPATSPPPYEHDAFLSYAASDLDLARALHDKLVAAGVHVWFDKAKLTVGTNINLATEEALDRSRHLIALLSPEALAADWTSMERHVATFGDADARRRTVLPIVVRDVAKLPASLRFLHSLRVDSVADLDRVLPEILSTLKATAKDPSKPAPPLAPSRAKAALVLVSRALAVLAALGPVAHVLLPQPFTRQWATFATPAVLALTIGVEVTFQGYRAAILEIAALVAAMAYVVRLPPETPAALLLTPATTAAVQTAPASSPLPSAPVSALPRQATSPAAPAKSPLASPAPSAPLPRSGSLPMYTIPTSGSADCTSFPTCILQGHVFDPPVDKHVCIGPLTSIGSISCTLTGPSQCSISTPITHLDPLYTTWRTCP
jgi:TIR domain